MSSPIPLENIQAAHFVLKARESDVITTNEARLAIVELLPDIGKWMSVAAVPGTTNAAA